MPHRAFAADLTQPEVILSESEAHHVLHVLRGRVGDELELFDGAGTVARAVIAAAARRDVTCRIASRTREDVVRRCAVTVCSAPPKGDRLKWLVEKLTELGVDELQLMQTHRTVVVPGETRIEKLRTSVIAACKQCGRNRLMDVRTLAPFADVLRPNEGGGDRPIRLIAHPGSDSRSLTAVLATTERHRSVQVLIGPEGGFTPDEIQQALRAGAIAVEWPGGHILRIETAAIAFASVILQSRTC